MRTRLMLAVVAALVGALALAGIVFATTPSGLTNVLLVRGTNLSDGTIPLQGGMDVAMAQITVVPGGSSGWHLAGTVAIVSAGVIVFVLSRALGPSGETFGTRLASGLALGFCVLGVVLLRRVDPTRREDVEDRPATAPLAPLEATAG